MTYPVVMMPLNQDLIDANLTVEQLQTFQHVDNVVEVQLQPCPVPPQSTTVVDTSFFERVNNMMNTFDNLIPLLTKLGSDRRFPTAGPSESVSLNPLASVTDSAPQVPVVAPQSPALAPGPSSASLEPRASTSGLQQRHQGDFASPRGRSCERDSSRGSCHASPSLQDRLRRQMDDVHRQLINAKEIVDLYNAQGRLPPDQARYDIEFLQDRYAQLHVAYEESLASTSFHSHGPSPSPHVVASPGVAHIAPTPGSSGLHRPRSPYRFSSRSERYEQRVASSDTPAHSSRPRSRESHLRELDFPSKSSSPHRPSSQRRSTSRRSSSPRQTPPPAQRRVASRRTPPPAQRHASQRTPSPTQKRVSSKGSPPPKRVAGDPGEGSSSAKRPLSRGSQSQRRFSRESLSPKRGSPSPKRRRYEERDSVSPPPHHSSRASSREPSQERPHSRSSPRPASPSREEKEDDEAPIPATVKAMVEFIKTNFPDAIASLAQKSSRSFDLSASVGVTDPATPSGLLLGWSQVMSDAFLDTQKKFSQRIQEGRTCHTLLPSLHRLEKVSNSPTQGKELTANPDVLDLLKNKVPDFRHLPISIKEGVALERTLRSMMESHSFLTWSVMGLLKSLHLKSLLPKDDPVITQLQKSFSKACSSLASSMTTSAAFVTMKRRQLLLSHVVPSVSEAQKRNLLSDPFFQTSSLFDASSVESARSAARDMSLFKPHLKASTSSSQARRQGPSSSSGRRGSARQYSGPSSSQRASSPFRQQSGKKGDARFHKKSSGTPQKRGGFSEVGASSLTGGWRLPSQQLVGLAGSGSGLLGSGGTAGWLSDPLRPSTSSIRASALPAGVLPTLHQGSRLKPGASRPSSEGGSRTSPSVSGFLQPSLPRQEGFGVLAPHHRFVDPERLHHLVTLPHGDSSVSPEFHPSRRLDDLPGPARFQFITIRVVFFASW